MDDGLAHEHPVEGIAMERRQPVEMKGRFLIQPEGVDAVAATLRRHEPHGRVGQRQPADGVLEGDQTALR
ncbi:MAG: hypothetical protein ACRELA_01035 [Candidatus Rokuibacteriota bacterium]